MITPDFRIDTDLFCFHMKQGEKEGFFLKHSLCPSAQNTFANTPRAEVTLLYSPSFRFDPPANQLWLAKVIIEQMRKRAKQILPQRLAFLAQTHNLTYTSVSINSARTRWGSCSSRKSINLSLYLLLLPSALIDYVLLHELCHTRELNHGPRFWALLDSFTQGQAKRLRQELRCFRPQF